METMQGDRLQVQSTGKRFYMIVVAQALMAVLCRSRRVCMSKWRGWKGREEKGTVIAVGGGNLSGRQEKERAARPAVAELTLTA